MDHMKALTAATGLIPASAALAASTAVHRIQRDMRCATVKALVDAGWGGAAIRAVGAGAHAQGVRARRAAIAEDHDVLSLDERRPRPLMRIGVSQTQRVGR